jgi:hypothetical protein
VILSIFESTKHEIVFIQPPSLIHLAANYASMQSAERFIKNGGAVRGIIPISRDNVEGMRKRLDIGYDLRRSDQFHEIFLLVGDKQQSISAINLGVREYTLETPISAFWSDSRAYAQYLLTSFENAWSEAVRADVRIKELLDQG